MIARQVRILMLDLANGGNDMPNDRIHNGKNLMYVIQLLAKLGEDFGLKSNIDPSNVNPKSPRDRSQEYWLEVADERQNLLWRITPRESFPNDTRDKPTPMQICQALNAYCVRRRILGIQFEVPQPEPA